MTGLTGTSRLAVVLALSAAAACTTHRTVHVEVNSTPETPDAGPAKSTPKDPDPTDDDDDDVAPNDAGAKDSGKTDPKDAAPAGLTPTRKTTAVMAINNVTRTLDRAQFGFDSDGTYHIEAHEGGDPACPDEHSPSPKRTLIVSGVKKADPGTKETKPDVSASFLDFAGDQIPNGMPAKASAVTIEIVAIKGTTEIEIEVSATFPSGTAKGRIFAEFCQSLSE